MVRLVSELRSRTDYILGMDRRFQEFRLPGPSAQLGPLHGPGLPAERPPDRAQEIPGREETVAGEATMGINEDGSTFRGSTESRAKGATA